MYISLLIRPCLCAGKYTASDGEADCVACGAGKYAASPLSATACVDCVKGKYSSTVEASSESVCLDCGAGKYSSADSVSMCLSCGAGNSSEALNQTLGVLLLSPQSLSLTLLTLHG